MLGHLRAIQDQGVIALETSVLLDERADLLNVCHLGFSYRHVTHAMRGICSNRTPHMIRWR